jgi:Zn-finger domain-containing protein
LLKKIALIEPIKEILKEKNIDISKLEKFGKIKKEKTKKFLDLLSGL